MATFEHRVGNPLPPENPVTVAELLRREVPGRRAAASGSADPDADRRPLPRIPAPRIPAPRNPAPRPPHEDLVDEADASLEPDPGSSVEYRPEPPTGGHALPGPDDPGPSRIISVGALLRREGRAPHTVDRPVQPRPAQLGRRSHPGARRTAVAAGALLATGSVVAAAIFTDAANRDSRAEAAAEGSFPGMSLRDGSPDALPGRGLDAGHAAPTSWMTVAFPSALVDPATAAALGGAPSPAGAGSTAVPGAPSFVGPVAAGAGAAAAPGGAPTGAGGTPGNVLDPILGGGGAGGAARGGSGGSGSGSVVGGVGGSVGAAVGPLTTPVVDHVVAPVTEKVLAPVTDTVKPAVTPLVDAVEPVSTPVLSAAAPVAAPLLKATAPVTDPLLAAAAPVTGLLDTSAATHPTPGSPGPAAPDAVAKTGKTGSAIEQTTQATGPATHAATHPVEAIGSAASTTVTGLLGGGSGGA